MKQNVYTLTHTCKTLPLKGTQTKGSLTKAEGGLSLSPGNYPWRAS